MVYVLALAGYRVGWRKEGLKMVQVHKMMVKVMAAVVMVVVLVPVM